jgi:hypothetical protein
MLHVVAAASGIAVYTAMDTASAKVYTVLGRKDTFDSFIMHIEISPGL